MHITTRSFGLALGLTFAAALVAAPNTAEAQRFFGQDVRWAEGAAVLAGSNSLAQRTSFLSSLSGVGTETFEGFSVGQAAPLNLSFAGAGTATLNNNGSVISGLGAGRRATSGSNFWEVSTGSQAGQEFTIGFSQRVAAFGVYGVDVGDFNAQLTMSFFDGVNLVHTWSPAHGFGNPSNEGNLNFFGYINTSNLFNSVRFSSTGGGEDVWGFDDMTIGSREQVVAVPEPASLALLAIGFAGLVAIRRRTRAES